MRRSRNSFSSAQAVNMFLACSEHVPRLVFLRNTKVRNARRAFGFDFFHTGFFA